MILQEVEKSEREAVARPMATLAQEEAAEVAVMVAVLTDFVRSAVSVAADVVADVADGEAMRAVAKGADVLERAGSVAVAKPALAGLAVAATAAPKVMAVAMEAAAKKVVASTRNVVHRLQPDCTKPIEN